MINKVSSLKYSMQTPGSSVCMLPIPGIRPISRKGITSKALHMNKTEEVQVLALSDDGACLNFGRSAFFSENSIQPVGQWSGRIKTLNQVMELETPFFNLNARTRDNRYIPMFVLATEDISFKRRAEDIVIQNTAIMFNVKPTFLLNTFLMLDFVLFLMIPTYEYM